MNTPTATRRPLTLPERSKLIHGTAQQAAANLKQPPIDDEWLDAERRYLQMQRWNGEDV